MINSNFLNFGAICEIIIVIAKAMRLYCCFIFEARERDASAYEKRIGMEMSESLRKLIAPHFLRRTKAMVLENKKENTGREVTDGFNQSDKENKPENQAR